MVLDRDKYFGEAMRQLTDREVYIPLAEDPTKEIIENVNVRINLPPLTIKVMRGRGVFIFSQKSIRRGALVGL